MSEPELDGSQIQADIAPGFRLPYQVILSVGAAPGAVARIVGLLLPFVSVMNEAVCYHTRRIETAKASNAFGVASFVSLRSSEALRWLNVAIAAPPLEGLGLTAPSNADRSFKLGLAARSSTLGDTKDPSMPGFKGNWVAGGPHNPVGMLIILGSDDKNALDAFTAEIEAECVGAGGKIVHRDCGTRLPGDKEHFGFRDGISQPGLRGTLAATGEPLTPRRIAYIDDADTPDFSAPGEVLLWPGEFIFGYPAQDPNHYRRAFEGPLVDETLRNGSFLVFRRLRQHVAAFHAATAKIAEDLRTSHDFATSTDAWLRANLVGRWPSGAPLQSFPDRDPGDPPGTLDAFNHFLFHGDTAPVTTYDGQPIPGTSGDTYGLVCPHFAHIRKVNPRDSGTNLGGGPQTEKLRLLRRGIPYGAQAVDPATDDGIDRGLLFVSFQRSIRGQFEKLSQNWMNSELAPEDARGHDVLVGQIHEPPPGRRLARFTKVVGGPLREVSTATDWIEPTGGGYFFCPSIATLERIATVA